MKLNFKKMSTIEIASHICQQLLDIDCMHASHLATPRIHTWPTDASTLGRLAH